MLDDTKYKNIIEQIHELNRQNYLNSDENIDKLIYKINKLEEKIENKKFTLDIKEYILFSLLGINLLLTLSIFFVHIFANEVDSEEKFTKNNNSEVKIEQKISTNDEILKFNQDSLKNIEDIKYEDIKPIIKKGTPFFCEGEISTKQIPYTVEIKGKLYSDKFTFILQENSKNKDCFIKKDNL
ncbi:MAG: hypothetical protein AB7S49_05600 [Arcobacter sp.]|jgi:hypothetical protein|uniref:hypothetical protein n=1 Tax=unclassified Arcobacter TaxID=2593671 RepID=UPI0002296055|nr:hypothetical protein [Arcobacter sp. L]BAK74068.1 hypothetical protein ABLL_2193 [Arcobacter sp. L]